jgi:hypothetical protein
MPPSVLLLLLLLLVLVLQRVVHAHLVHSWWVGVGFFLSTPTPTKGIDVALHCAHHHH